MNKNPTPDEFLAQYPVGEEEQRTLTMRHSSMADAWDNCTSPKWLIWVIGCLRLDEINVPPPRLSMYADESDTSLLLFACWCAACTPMPDGRVTGALLPGPRAKEVLAIFTMYGLGLIPCAYQSATYHSACGDLMRASNEIELASWWTILAYGQGRSHRAALNASRMAAKAAAMFADDEAGKAAAHDVAYAAQANQLRTLFANPFG